MPAGDWYGVAHVPPMGRLVAVGHNGQCATSDDGGQTWISRTIPAGHWRAAKWNGQTLVAIASGAGGTARCATSPDGVTWTEQAFPSAGGVAREPTALEWTGRLYVAVETSITAPSRAVFTSRDGQQWAAHTIAVPSSSGYGWWSVAWVDRLAVIVGSNAVATSQFVP